MKKNLLSFLLIVSVNLVFSQFPCVSSYQITNGGSSCPDLNGSPPTGTISLSLDGPLGSIIPTIEKIFNITDPANQFEVTGIDFGPGTLSSNGTVKYCYYPGPGNNNNLGGGNVQYRFLISYDGTLCGEQAPLPVSFRAFTALRNKSAVALKWTTATESGNLGFEIQRMIGNGNWQTVSFIATQATNGSSSSDLSYTYTDLNPAKGMSQYRIRQIDLDGKSKLSEIRAVRGDGQKLSAIIYPNPSNDGKVSIVFSEAETVRDVSVIDINGRIIRKWKGITDNNLKIENLTPGLYSVRIIDIDSGEQTVEKFVIKNR